MTQLPINDIVDKLIGPVTAVGETNADNRRLENLRHLISLAEHVVSKLCSASQAVDMYESSMRKIGATAYDALKGIKGSIVVDDDFVGEKEEEDNGNCVHDTDMEDRG